MSVNFFDDGKNIFCLDDVQHVEKLYRIHKPIGSEEHTKELWAILIITKFTTWNFEQDTWENPIYLQKEKSEEFLKVWMDYRKPLQFEMKIEERTKKDENLSNN